MGREAAQARQIKSANLIKIIRYESNYTAVEQHNTLTALSLSACTLTCEQLSVLKKGLNFIPTRKLDLYDMPLDVTFDSEKAFSQSGVPNCDYTNGSDITSSSE